MTQEVKRVLVYGTLRPDPERHTAYNIFGLDEACNYIGSTRIPGTMYNVGRFPGVILDNNPKGFVVDILEIVNPDILDSLDRYEGYYADRPEHYSLYLRRTVEVDGVSAYIYEFNEPVDELEKVESGDWMKRQSE